MNSSQRTSVPESFPDPNGHVCEHGMWHPSVRIMEFVKISNDLASRISKQPNHVTIFPHSTQVQPEQDDTPCALLPITLTATPPAASGSDGIIRTLTKWDKVVGELIKLKAICESGVAVPNMAQLLHDTIEVYCHQANQYSNFNVLDNPEMCDLVTQAIPQIVMLAVQFPILLSKPIPILKSGESRTIYATRKLLASILANAFFCTFPEPEQDQATPDFNFFTLFHTNPKFPASATVKREKLKCILNYFHMIYKETCSHHQIVSYERRCVAKRVAWAKIGRQLNIVHVASQGKIESCQGMLQVDFANKVIGGGVFMESCVMEDIRFCISPELLVARLFTQNLEDNEVLVVTGSEIFSEYDGYGSSFKFTGPTNLNLKQTMDTMGRTYTQMVAMDAHYFKADNKQLQYEQAYLDRELHKCYVAFIHGPNFVSSVASGNWGCGKFNGDKEFKFLIQWMAASIQDRPKLQFHTIGEKAFSKEIDDITEYVRRKNISIGDLYNVLCQFHGDLKKHARGGVFKYVKNKL